MDIFAENICEFCRENRKTLCELHRNGGLLDKIRPDILLILSILCGQNATRHGAFVKVAKIIVEIGDVFMYNVYIGGALIASRFEMEDCASMKGEIFHVYC